MMPHDQWSVRLEVDPDPSLRAKVLAPLEAHNESAAGPGHWFLDDHLLSDGADLCARPG